MSHTVAVFRVMQAAALILITHHVSCMNQQQQQQQQRQTFKVAVLEQRSVQSYNISTRQHALKTITANLMEMEKYAMSASKQVRQTLWHWHIAG